MGRAIVREPKAFLMDEPLSNLDAKLRVQTRMEIARLQRRLSSTMLYVTHDQVEAMTLGDRVITMRAGRLQQAGPPKELYDRPANVFVAGFIGSPAMNLLGATIERDEVVLPFARVPLTRERRAALAVHDGEPLIAGARPHVRRGRTAAPQGDRARADAHRSRPPRSRCSRRSAPSRSRRSRSRPTAPVAGGAHQRAGRHRRGAARDADRAAGGLLPRPPRRPARARRSTAPRSTSSAPRTGATWRRL